MRIAIGTPAADVEIDAARARELLRAQHPDLASLPIRALASGWDNAILRLGEDLALRFPRRLAAARLVEHEQRWLPELSPRLPLKVPTPVRVGAPGNGYPWSWSVVPWIEGEPSDLCPPGKDQGARLAQFLRALHRPAPLDAPRNPYRGVPLAERRDKFDSCLKQLKGRTELLHSRHLECWQAALDAPIDVADSWIHGDLHPRNVLVRQAEICGVIDWGDVARGDRATDLAALWLLLPERSSRAEAMQGCAEVSAASWQRARGWALLYALILLTAGLSDDARMAAIAARTLERLSEGP